MAFAAFVQRCGFLTVLSPMFIVSGFAFFRRKKFAVAMTYVWMGLAVLFFLIGLLGSFADPEFTSAQRIADITVSVFRTGIALAFWGACCKYYRKRRPEFA